MNKKLGSPRIFSYICPQNCNFVALLDIVGITERYACLTVVKPRKLSHVNPDDSVISPMLCVDCYYYALRGLLLLYLGLWVFLGPSTEDMERNSSTHFILLTYYY